MDEAILPVENAHEPFEEAHQPSLFDAMQTENMVTSSQSSSKYKDILSQPAAGVSHRQRLLWLQKRRAPGLWAQCDECSRWRYLPHVLDRHELPVKWYCRMNPDSTFASCSAPEYPIRMRDEEDLIHSEYNAGSLVMGRVEGWPWWPGMVDDCPDTEQYYWLDGFSDIPTHYNVVFFDAEDVTRAWLAPSDIKPFKDRKKVNIDLKKNNRERIKVALKQAKEAEKMTLTERLAKFSFVGRYKGDINSPKKVNKKEIGKYKELFERKFSVAMPDDEISDSESVPE
uniref:Zinc finger CW-type PWWP domain protein 1-like protein n=1 Tax=Bicyclus anynana TaxID=110368 RepID=A0A1C9EGK7_BICAN|nr:zinc finger CW-type PWWP domain protein 1-like protein [Bicyclus anynana]